MFFLDVVVKKWWIATCFGVLLTLFSCLDSLGPYSIQDHLDGYRYADNNFRIFYDELDSVHVLAQKDGLYSDSTKDSSDYDNFIRSSVLENWSRQGDHWVSQKMILDVGMFFDLNCLYSDIGVCILMNSMFYHGLWAVHSSGFENIIKTQADFQPLFYGVRPLRYASEIMEDSSLVFWGNAFWNYDNSEGLFRMSREKIDTLLLVRDIVVDKTDVFYYYVQPLGIKSFEGGFRFLSINQTDHGSELIRSTYQNNQMIQQEVLLTFNQSYAVYSMEYEGKPSLLFYLYGRKYCEEDIDDCSDESEPAQIWALSQNLQGSLREVQEDWLPTFESQMLEIEQISIYPQQPADHNPLYKWTVSDSSCPHQVEIYNHSDENHQFVKITDCHNQSNSMDFDLFPEMKSIQMRGVIKKDRSAFVFLECTQNSDTIQTVFRLVENRDHQLSVDTLNRVQVPKLGYEECLMLY